jgi:Domain of unknown function (DUF4395)
VASRTAHPYADTDVIDARAPRFNQATIGTLALVALLTGWWPLLAVLGLQLIVGLTFGRRFCLPCVFYFEVVQPLVGEGPIEDSRPPRFANILGAIFLSAASVAHVAGLSVVGWALGGAVAGLALLAATTGLCVGCEIYRLTARMRGIGSKSTPELDLADLGTASAEGLVVQFTHPLCTDCHSVARKLTNEGRRVFLVDVSARPDLAKKYGVVVVPTALAVAANGRVVERLA